MIKLVKKGLTILFVGFLLINLVALTIQFIQQPRHWSTQKQLLLVSCLLALLLRVYLSTHPNFLKAAHRQKLKQLGHFFGAVNFISITLLAVLMFATSLLNPTVMSSDFYQPAIIFLLNWLLIWQLITAPALEPWLAKYLHW